MHKHAHTLMNILANSLRSKLPCPFTSYPRDSHSDLALAMLAQLLVEGIQGRLSLSLLACYVCAQKVQI